MKTTLVGAILALTVSAGAVSAATWNFNGGNANLGKSSTFLDTLGTSSLTAYAINTEEPPTPSLHRNALGIGVDLGFGDVNQLDNLGDDEAIVFDFGSKYTTSSMYLSLAGSYDDFEIYGTNDGSVVGCTTGGLGCLTGVSTLLASGDGNGIEGFETVSLSGGSYRYLIATIVPGSGDGYRVKSLTATPDMAPVPLPAAGWMLLAGLGGLFAAKRRKA